MRENDGEINEELPASGYVDFWPHLHPNDPGFTYDIINNDLAKAISERITQYEGRTGCCNRFDQIFVKSTFWHPKEITKFGTEPICLTPDTKIPLFISDHYGLLAILSRSK